MTGADLEVSQDSRNKCCNWGKTVDFENSFSQSRGFLHEKFSWSVGPNHGGSSLVTYFKSFDNLADLEYFSKYAPG